jgi:hypothetical protein
VLALVWNVLRDFSQSILRDKNLNVASRPPLKSALPVTQFGSALNEKTIRINRGYPDA